MKIHKLIWVDDRIEHISRHGITPLDLEEVCFNAPLILQAKAEGANPVYYILGQTNSGQ